MELRVRHETRYRYRREVSFGRHRLVLRPREGHDLALLQQRLHITPAHAVSWMRDAHDNVIALVDFERPAAELSIVNELQVRRVAPFPLARTDDFARVPLPVAYDEREAPLIEAYLRPSYPADAPAVRAWARPHVPDGAADAEALVLGLAEAVHRSIAYRRRLERGVQTPAETLGAASGSCRDLAVLLIEAARGLGLGARFASGYLHGTASVAGRASTHAWAEIYLPMLGWRGVDPTLGKATDLRHVPLGVSHHPRGVMPVSGTFGGTSADLLEHTVSVHTESSVEPRAAS